MQKNISKITNLRYIKGKQAGRTYHTQNKVQPHTPASPNIIYIIPNNNMTGKEKALVEALCDAYGLDYPEAEDEDDTRTEEELYLDKESSYEFTSWCYINREWLSLADIIRILRENGFLDDDF